MCPATVAIVIEGGQETFQAAFDAVTAGIPVLVLAGTGKAADFIAAAYDKREQPLVFISLQNNRLLARGNMMSYRKLEKTEILNRILTFTHDFFFRYLLFRKCNDAVNLVLSAGYMH